MAVPFGFSIGDFIAVADLARKLSNALSESRGSIADYKLLCEQLFSLIRSLEVASAILLYSSSSFGNTISIGPLNGIRHELGTCKRLMEDFLTQSKKYTEALCNGKGSRAKRELRKITWCLFKDGDVQKLRASLKCHIDAFSLYSNAVLSQGVFRTEQKAIKTLETSDRIERQTTEISRTVHQMVVKISDTGDRREALLKEMLSRVKTVQFDMPKVMGYAWEGDQKPILFEDALGQVVQLPLVLCSTKEVFHCVLQILFKDRPGQKRITENQYQIVEGSSGALIEDANWESKVLPGVQVSMGIVVVIPTKPPLKTKNWNKPLQHIDQIVDVCPRCGTPNKGATPVKESLKCRKCCLIFQEQRTERIVEERDIKPIQSRTGVSAHQERQQTPSDIPRQSNDHAIFRRIHYCREITKYSNSGCGDYFCTGGCQYAGPKERALVQAAADGDREKVSLLISNLTEINVLQCKLGRTAIQAAAEGGHLEIVELLLTHSADVNAEPAWHKGRTALQAAAEGGHLEIVELLLSHSADVNAEPAEHEGRTALQAAAERGHTAIKQLLLTHS